MEELNLFVSYKWLEHLGYSLTEIEYGDRAIDHQAFGCEFEGYGWNCFDENDLSRHRFHDEVQTEIDKVVGILEIAVPKIIRELEESFRRLEEEPYYGPDDSYEAWVAGRRSTLGEVKVILEKFK